MFSLLSSCNKPTIDEKVHAEIYRFATGHYTIHRINHMLNPVSRGVIHLRIGVTEWLLVTYHAKISIQKTSSILLARKTLSSAVLKYAILRSTRR